MKLVDLPSDIQILGYVGREYIFKHNTDIATRYHFRGEVHSNLSEVINRYPNCIIFKQALSPNELETVLVASRPESILLTYPKFNKLAVCHGFNLLRCISEDGTSYILRPETIDSYSRSEDKKFSSFAEANQRLADNACYNYPVYYFKFSLSEEELHVVLQTMNIVTE